MRISSFEYAWHSWVSGFGERSWCSIDRLFIYLISQVTSLEVPGARGREFTGLTRFVMGVYPQTHIQYPKRYIRNNWNLSRYNLQSIWLNNSHTHFYFILWFSRCLYFDLICLFKFKISKLLIIATCVIHKHQKGLEMSSIIYV